MSKNEKISLIIIFVLAIIIIAGGVYFWWDSRTVEVKKVKEKIEEQVEDIVVTPEAEAGNFATYQEVDVNISPKVSPYTVKSDFSNVENYDQFTFSESAQDLLFKNYFAVVPAYNDEFFSIYESNRYDLIPSFITTDSVLHNYHLLFNYLLKKVEKEKLYQAAVDLTDEMLQISERQYEDLQDTDWASAAKRNIAFFTVAQNLLDENADIDKLVENEVEAELDLIDEHAGITESIVINMGQNIKALDAYREDYSQYVPRGHYTKTEELKKYFKALMWYGRINFRLKSDDETKSSILMTQALRNNKQAFANWEIIFNPVSFFVGKTDDLTFYDYDLIYDQVYKGNSLTDAEKFSQFKSAVKNLDKPKINSMPIFQAEIMPDREEEIFGWRFMGQRYTVDAEVFQHLIDREVEDRMLPKGLDIPAAFGSELAADQLESEGEFEYPGYETNLKLMQDYVKTLDVDIWTQNLYWGWLYTLTDLIEPVDKGYPSFMNNKAWQYKDLQTILASWTELKHDTILYAKQVYAELGGAPEDEGDDRGYVEPRPYVYARLASLLKMTSEGLQVRQLIDEDDIALLERFEKLVLDLKEISEKELNNEKLSEEDYELIKYFGGDLEHLWLEVMRDEGVTSRAQTNDNPAALVADVATDPNGFVLEEAIGHVDAIYVIFPLDGKLRIGKGGVFSHYEFMHPMSDRLTDEAWQEILYMEEEPERAEWHSNFLAD